MAILFLKKRKKKEKIPPDSRHNYGKLSYDELQDPVRFKETVIP
jgi:hypothetical protein